MTLEKGHYSQQATEVSSDWCPLFPKSHGGSAEVDTGKMLHLGQGTPNSGNPCVHSGLQANLPPLPWKKTWTYYTREQINLPSAPEGNIISLFQSPRGKHHLSLPRLFTIQTLER